MNKISKTSKYFKTLSWRIFITTLLLSFLAISATAYQSWHYAQKTIHMLIADHIRETVASKKNELENMVDKIKSEFSFFVFNSCFKNVSDNHFNIHNICSSISNISQSGIIDEISVYSSSWDLLYSSKDSSSHMHSTHSSPDSFVLTEDFKKKIESAGGVIADSPFSDDSGIIYMYLAYPVSTENNTPAYFIGKANLTNAFSPIFNTSAPRHTSTRTYLISPAGNYLNCSKENMTGPCKSSCFLLQKPETIIQYSDNSGKTVTGFSCPVFSDSLYLIAESDETLAFSWLNQLKITVSATAIIIAFIVAIVSLRLAGKLSSPFISLADAAEKIQAGEIHERMHAPDTAESGMVADAFNNTLDKLDTTHKHLVNISSLARVGEVTSSIVHEIRNPLTTIKMNLQAVSDEPGMSDDLKELLKIALDQSLRVEKMMNDILQFGKPVEIHPIPSSVRTIISDTAESLKSSFPEITFQINASNTPDLLKIDTERIRRIIENLSLNSCQSMNQGKIFLSAHFEPVKKLLTLTVQDTGPGISEKDRLRIFNPFFTTKSFGTGLGLSNVKKIVDYYRGEIYVESIPGNTVFTVILPAEEV